MDGEGRDSAGGVAGNPDAGNPNKVRKEKLLVNTKGGSSKADGYIANTAARGRPG